MGMGGPEMKRIFSQKRILFAVPLCGFLSLVILFAGPCLIPEINCWYESIDINAGRFRSESYVFGLRISDRIRETEMSRARQELGGQPRKPGMTRCIDSPR